MRVALTYGASQNWTAPSTGNVLVTWFKISPFAFACTAGHLGFAFRLDGTGSNHNFITNFSRFGVGGGGDVNYSPIVEKFAVTAGTAYNITTLYFAQSWTGCQANTMGNSNGSETFKIEYVQ